MGATIRFFSWTTAMPVCAHTCCWTRCIMYSIDQLGWSDHFLSCLASNDELCHNCCCCCEAGARFMQDRILQKADSDGLHEGLKHLGCTLLRDSQSLMKDKYGNYVLAKLL